MLDPSVPGAVATALLSALADGASHELHILAESFGLNRRQVSDAAAKLALRGLVNRPASGRYQLTAAGMDAQATGTVITSGPIGPTNARHVLRDTFRERAWRAMRVHRRFTIGEVVAAAERGERDARGNARRFISELKSAGYLRELPARLPGTRPGSNGYKQFLLVRDTGPQPPILSRKRGALYDPNTGEDVPCATS